MQFSFTGKTAIVTGGARGIGFECARQLAECGANVVLVDMLEKEGGESRAKLAALGVKAAFHRADVADFDLMKRLAAGVKDAFGSVDICVTAAGVLSVPPLLELGEAEVNRVMRINVNGVMAVTMAALPHMMAQKSGKIVTIGSTAGKVGGGINGNIVYGMSKAAVICYTKGLARDAAPHGINVNCVCPGPTETTMMDGCSREKLDRMLAGSMLPRFATPQDIAHSVLFLCSEYASYITSSVHMVDGGRLVGN